MGYLLYSHYFIHISILCLQKSLPAIENTRTISFIFEESIRELGVRLSL